MSIVASLSFPDDAKSKINRLETVFQILSERLPDITLTCDLVEYRGLEYQRGVSFTAFAQGARGELGRGGHYIAGEHLGDGVPATGFTLFMDSVLRCVPAPAARKRVYIPLDVDPAAALRLREAGWVTVAALDGTDPATEASRLGCDMVLADGHLVAITPAPETAIAPPRTEDAS